MSASKPQPLQCSSDKGGWFDKRESRIRDLALFDLAVDSKLRGCDLVQLRIGQLVINAAARHRATIVQQKTGKPVQFELTQQTRESLIAWLTHRRGGLQDFVFPSRVGCRTAISARVGMRA